MCSQLIISYSTAQLSSAQYSTEGWDKIATNHFEICRNIHKIGDEFGFKQNGEALVVNKCGKRKIRKTNQIKEASIEYTICQVIWTVHKMWFHLLNTNCNRCCLLMNWVNSEQWALCIEHADLYTLNVFVSSKSKSIPSISIFLL